MLRASKHGYSVMRCFFSIMDIYIPYVLIDLVSSRIQPCADWGGGGGGGGGAHLPLIGA